MSEPGNSAPGSTAQGSAPAAQPGSAQPGRQDQAVNPRSRGTSPARDARESVGGQQADQGFEIDGVRYEGEQVRSALRAAAEQDVRLRGLPTDPGGYRAELPTSFQPPAGMAWQFDANDPALVEFRRIAHARSIDQATFSDALGVYASTELRKQQQTNALVSANREKLGSAADQRLDTIGRWLTSIAGAKATPMVTALRQFPLVETVEALETIIRKFSNQGGAEFSQSHREQTEQNTPPNFESYSFAQKRAWQDSVNSRGNKPRR